MILLTGATGFLGSRLLDVLLGDGYKVVALKRSSSSIEKIKCNLNSNNLILFDIDLCDPQKIFEKYSIDTIIHVATEYGRGTTPLVKILEANLILPLRLAELGISNNVKCFINTDSYFNKSNNSYSNLLNYSLSKKSLLIWLNQLSGKLKIINVVLEHIYGPGDGESKFIESLVRNIAILKVQRVPLTHGHQKRDFVYLDDVVAAYPKLVEYGRSHDFSFKTFELGTGYEVQVRDVAEIIKRLSNSPSVIGYGDIPYRRDEIMTSSADNSALVELGWTPKIGIYDGLSKLLRSYGVMVNDFHY